MPNDGAAYRDADVVGINLIAGVHEEAWPIRPLLLGQPFAERLEHVGTRLEDFLVGIAGPPPALLANVHRGRDPFVARPLAARAVSEPEGVERSRKRAEEQPLGGSERNLPNYGGRTTTVSWRSRKHCLREVTLVDRQPSGRWLRRERDAVLVHGVRLQPLETDQRVMPATHPHAGCIALALGRWHLVDRQLALIRGLPKGDAHESG